MAAGRIGEVGHPWLHSALQARAGRGGPRRAVVVVVLLRKEVDVGQL